MKLSSLSLTVGDYMKVPKGSPLLPRWSYSSDPEPELTKRDVVVELKDIYFPNTQDSKLTAEEHATWKAELIASRAKYEEVDTRLRIHPETYSNGVTRQNVVIADEDKAEYGAANSLYHHEHREINERHRDLGISRFTEADILVMWGDGKITRYELVSKAEKPEARKKEPKVNLRQQMVPKSRWKITQDKDIIYNAPNPAYHAALKAWDDANPRPTGHGNHTTYDTWHKAFIANRDANEATLGMYVPKVYRSVKAGEIFTVTDKFQTYFNPYGWHGERLNNVCPVLIDGEKDVLGFEYSHIKDIIEVESIPTVKAYVLRHRETGLYYKSYGLDEEASKAAKKARIDAGDNDKVYYDDRVWASEHADTFMKGKKWDNLGKAKTSILMMTGYYDGLPGADDSIPEWSGGGASMSSAELHEHDLVEFDKLSRKEVGVVSDFHGWYDHSWSLRDLTVKFGSSVRTVYKALEKAKLLDTQKGVAVFTCTDEDKLDNVGYWGERTALTDQDKQEIADAIASIGADKKTFKQALDTKSAAISFTSKSAAMMFKLAYSGNLKLSIIDLEDMKEAISE